MQDHSVQERMHSSFWFHSRNLPQETKTSCLVTYIKHLVLYDNGIVYGPNAQGSNLLLTSLEKMVELDLSEVSIEDKVFKV